MECYAYIMYEKENLPGSTGEVLCFADSIEEMSRRMKLSRSWLYDLLASSEDENKFKKCKYEVRKVYLN